MTPRTFDDSERCNGDTLPAVVSVAGALCPMCLTCSRLTYRRDVPLLKGKVYRITEQGPGQGTSDCAEWRPHVVTVRPGGAWTPSQKHGARYSTSSADQELAA